MSGKCCVPTAPESNHLFCNGNHAKIDDIAMFIGTDIRLDAVSETVAGTAVRAAATAATASAASAAAAVAPAALPTARTAPVLHLAFAATAAAETAPAAATTASAAGTPSVFRLVSAADAARTGPPLALKNSLQLFLRSSSAREEIFLLGHLQ